MKRWGPLALLAVVGVFGVLLVPQAQRLAAFLPPCPFRTVTGVPCPTCGTTRALLALSKGHLAQALTCNPMTTLGLVFAGLVAVIWALAHAWGLRVPRALASWQYHWPWWLRLGVIVALVANWAWVVAQS